ncbi:MAG: hypothetical protein Q4D02_08290 [Clostridia bacterium]|nr:hypothetical protein [Clostridia bacterium]
MLGKLLKYDLKWIYKVLIVFYTLAFIFSIIGRVFSMIENSVVFSVTTQITLGLAISMMISSLINCLMRLWARFIRNGYKDESYLTHTLPVKKKTIYASKVLTAFISIFTTTIVIVACLFICYYSKSNMQILKSLLELAASTYNTTVLKLLLLVFFVVFLEMMFVVLIGYVGIILGHKSNQNKMIKTIIISFALYFLTQAFTLGCIYIFGLFNSNVMNLINTTDIVDIDAIRDIMYMGIGIYTLYIIFYYILGKKQFEKGVNID